MAAKTPRIIIRMSNEESEPKRMLPTIQGYENERVTTLEKAVQQIIPFVPDVLKMVAEVKQMCQNPKDNLTVDESSSIMLYTLEKGQYKPAFYVVLNQTLQEKNREKLRPWFLYLRLVMNALAKLPPTTCRIIYRAINRDLMQDYPKDLPVTWWGFTSCTSTLDVLQKFLGDNGSGTIFNIEFDSGKDISQHSYFPDENEILLYPARQFTVISSLKTGKQNRTIHLKEIQPQLPLIHIPRVTSTTTTRKHHVLMNRIKEFQCRTKIDLSSQNLTDDDMYLIVQEVIINKECTWLYLEKNKITSIGASIIAKAFNDNKSLQWIDMSHNHLGNEGVRALTEVLSLNNSRLKALYLWSVELTDDGIEYISDMLKVNRVLTHLGLAENRISEVGIRCLNNVLSYGNNTLTELDLSHNKSINDLNVDSIIQMIKGSRSLTDLNLEKCNFSSRGKDKLVQSAKSKTNFNLSI
ncbi:hypothetical protein I4U23_019864 [Adineta vaga]|nr:hypothetical protein I4U23_019864 [Adineta vaga]